MKKCFILSEAKNFSRNVKFFQYPEWARKFRDLIFQIFFIGALLPQRKPLVMPETSIASLVK